MHSGTCRYDPRAMSGGQRAVAVGRTHEDHRGQPSHFAVYSPRNCRRSAVPIPPRPSSKTAPNVYYLLAVGNSGRRSLHWQALRNLHALTLTCYGHESGCDACADDRCAQRETPRGRDVESSYRGSFYERCRKWIRGRRERGQEVRAASAKDTIHDESCQEVSAERKGGNLGQGRMKELDRIAAWHGWGHFRRKVSISLCRGPERGMRLLVSAGWL